MALLLECWTKLFFTVHFCFSATAQSITLAGLSTNSKINETVTLTCLYNNPGGLPISFVRWRNSGGTIIYTFQPPNGKNPAGPLLTRTTEYNHTSTSTTLYIGNTTESDEGSYSCLINAGGDFPPATPTFTIYEDLPPGADVSITASIMPDEYNRIFVPEDASLIINASAPCARPNVGLTWSDENVILPPENCSSNGKSKIGHAMYYLPRMVRSKNNTLLTLFGHHLSFKLDNCKGIVNTKCLKNYTLLINISTQATTKGSTDGIGAETTMDPNGVTRGVLCCYPQISREAQITVCVIFALTLLCGAGVLAFSLYNVYAQKTSDGVGDTLHMVLLRDVPNEVKQQDILEAFEGATKADLQISERDCRIAYVTFTKKEDVKEALGRSVQLKNTTVKVLPAKSMKKWAFVGIGAGTGGAIISIVVIAVVATLKTCIYDNKEISHKCS